MPTRVLSAHPQGAPGRAKIVAKCEALERYTRALTRRQ